MSRYELTSHLIDASYRLFGKWVPNFPTFRNYYYRSGPKMAYESYLALAIFVCASAFVSTFIAGSIVQCVFFTVPLARSIAGAFVLSFVSVMLVLICLIACPLMRLGRNRAEIDSNLIYTVGYMSVLSVGGISIERVFNRVVEVEPRSSIKELATRFVTNVKLLGVDVASSLEDVRMRSASDVLAKLLLSIINTIKTSGDLKTLLIFETNRLLTLKREQLKKTLSAMVALAELYVTAMVMAPVTFIIMLTLLSVLGNSQFGLSSVTQLNLIVFLGIPIICVVFIVMLDSVLPKED